jgi:hypothetical protein
LTTQTDDSMAWELQDASLGKFKWHWGWVDILAELLKWNQ